MNRGEGIHHLDKKSVRPRLTCLHVLHEDYKSPMPLAGEHRESRCTATYPIRRKRGAEVNIAFLIGKDCLGAYWLMASSQEIATFSLSSWSVSCPGRNPIP